MVSTTAVAAAGSVVAVILGALRVILVQSTSESDQQELIERELDTIGPRPAEYDCEHHDFLVRKVTIDEQPDLAYQVERLLIGSFKGGTTVTAHIHSDEKLDENQIMNHPWVGDELELINLDVESSKTDEIIFSFGTVDKRSVAIGVEALQDVIDHVIEHGDVDSDDVGDPPEGCP